MPAHEDNIELVAQNRIAASKCCLHDLFRDPRLWIQRRLISISSTSPDGEQRTLLKYPEKPVEVSAYVSQRYSQSEEQRGTFLYLAYGSNLCHETFQGRRGIKPLSQVNVLVPELRLTFDLPGVPYSEPCFANSGQRDPTEDSPSSVSLPSTATTRPLLPTDYHKDRWHKGLVGVVYEVTLTDYAHIIATEGGGSSYHDILVTCHVLPPHLPTVPDHPPSNTPTFRAHTLFSPGLPPDTPPDRRGGRFARPDPAYAQPSARYLKLITDGADEHALPADYKAYLHEIRTYTVTTQGQRLGQFIFLTLWLPFVLLLFALGRRWQDERGRNPAWLTTLSGIVFGAMWRSYDGLFLGLFGDGERSLKDGGKEGEVEGEARGAEAWKSWRLRKGWCGDVEKGAMGGKERGIAS